MAMTKKHHKMIARCCREYLQDDSFKAVFIDRLSTELKQDNINFNKDKFKEACYEPVDK